MSSFLKDDSSESMELGTNNNDFDYRDADESGFGHRSAAALPMTDSNLGMELSYLPPDQRGGADSALAHIQLADPDLLPDIEEDTEAAEALRANANIKVGKLGKVARSINAQSLRHIVKRATLRGRSGHTKGKPPRIPPGTTAAEESDDGQLLPVQEGSMEHEFSSSEESEPEVQMKMPLKPPAPPAKERQSNYAIPAGSEKVDFVSPTPTKPRFTGGMSISHDAKDIPADMANATMEAGKKLLGSVDPHNMLQASRWKRKKKKKEEKTKSYVKGKVIDGRHELYALSIAVMLGVRTSIAKTNSILTASNGRRMLTPQDFMAEEKYEFSPKGSATTPPHKLSHTFKFKDYAPLAFAYLRRMFGVNEFDFLLSVCGNANFIEFISNAKSGQFFFYSSDGKYMIKTMTNAESKFLRRILPHYFQHCTSNPNTLITKFLGMYRVKLYHLRRNVKFVIMNSVYHTDKYLQTFYDLKGSVLGRAAKPGQDVLKDNDLREKLPQDAMSLAPEVRQRVRAQIISDCEFLRKMKIMDYSLLLGIHHIPPKEEAQKAVGRKSIAKTGFHPATRRESLRKGSVNGDASSVGYSDAHSVGSLETPLSPGGRISMTAEQRKMELLKKNNPLVSEQGDSNKKLMSEIRESNLAMNNEMNGLWDDEDDGSYLEGANPSEEKRNTLNDIHRHQHFEDIEVKKEETVEQVYWPFHRFFDINGHRRMRPKKCYKCGFAPCRCEGNQMFIRGWGIPDFSPPLSNRKDGGFMMETEGLPMPMVWHGPKGDKLYEGKIFYFGIIDILQQYTAQKSIETRYRKLENIGPNGQDPSCVHPDEYARRFVLFFDEYSGPCIPDQRTINPEQTEIEVNRNEDDSDVDISISTPGERVEEAKPKPGVPPKFHVTI